MLILTTMPEIVLWVNFILFISFYLLFFLYLFIYVLLSFVLGIMSD